MTPATAELEYSVPGVSCGHCHTAIADEVERVAGVRRVEVDLDAKRVVVRGGALDDAAIRAAIEAAGYEVAP
ncbi:MAG TPA: heavy metal-associated domain-containing protein [Thermoleophilaceae bacterium]|nr:heavy metal-associated domain-containing protein [Thermoleophilaceae bacterium]